MPILLYGPLLGKKRLKALLGIALGYGTKLHVLTTIYDVEFIKQIALAI